MNDCDTDGSGNADGRRYGDRLTAAVEATGKSPQYIVDEALAEHLARLGF